VSAFFHAAYAGSGLACADAGRVQLANPAAASAAALPTSTWRRGIELGLSVIEPSLFEQLDDEASHLSAAAHVS
jgi:hypothetical protein